MAGRRVRKSLVTRKRAPVGAPPGTLIADPNAPQPEIRLIRWSADSIEERENVSIGDLSAAQGSKDDIWADVVGVGDASLVAEIGRIFGIESLALEDVLNLHQRPKAENFEHYLFVILHMVNGVDPSSKEQFALFLGPGFVLTFQERPGDCLEPVRERLRIGKGRIRTSGTGYAAYAVMDAIVDAYFPVAENLGEKLENLEDEISTSATPANVATLHEIKRDLLAVKRSLWPTREVINALRTDDNVHIRPETKRFLGDTHDHVMQLIDIVETYRELSSGLLDLYLSSLSNKMNEVMKVLTIIATIFIPLSFMAGIWGMNFATMPELNWAYGYPVALTSMVVVAAALIVWFRWRRWL